MKLKTFIADIIKEHLLNESTTTSEDTISNLRAELVAAAQKVYNEWDQDENGYDEMLGNGGICQDIADAMANVLSDHDIECCTVSQESGEQHVYVVAKLDDGVYNVDISPYTYETGGGYDWKKIPDVVFDINDIIIDCLSRDPDEFESYTNSY